MSNGSLAEYKGDEKEKLAVVLAEQQNQIQNVLAIADMAINRTYLPECTQYSPIAIKEDISSPTFLSKSRLYKLTRFVYNPEDSVMEKLKIIFLALAQLPLNPSVFLIIHNERARKSVDLKAKKEIILPGKLSLYFGIRTDSDASAQIGNMFQECFINTFPGSELESAHNDYKILENNDIENIVCVSAMPSVKKDDDGNAADIGLEQFIDSMRNHNYTAFLVATPVSDEIIQSRKRELENIYTQLSVYRKQTLAYGENESLSVSEGISKSFSKSKSIGKSFTKTTGESYGTTETQGTSTSHGSNSSSSMSGEGFSSSSGSNSSYSSSESYSKSETHSFSESFGNTESDTDTVSDGTSSTKGTAKGSSKTLTIERENKNIVCMLEKIDNALQRITDAEAYGLWECAAYFTSKETSDAILAANSYKALVLGDQSSDSLSYVTIWKTLNAQEQASNIDHVMRKNSLTKEEAIKQIAQTVAVQKTCINTIYPYILYGMHPTLYRESGFEQFQTISPTNAVNGKDLPRFFSVPLKSLPGIVVDSIASFERSVFTKKLDRRNNFISKATTIPLGCVFHMGNKDENTRVDLDIDSFTGHCFISGSTGSGKSNTMSKILEGLLALEHSEAERRINFLVIEPAKGEYKKDFHAIPGIKIFTTNPLSEQLLHLNPFRFPDGIHVLEHVDRLLNIFGSCWELTAAMPAILKKSVEQAYEAAGWDLCGSFYIGEGDAQYPSFASLVTELRNVIDSSDYSAEAKGNYTGALVTRVESLAGGMLRRIFCSETDVSYQDLFDSRTIIDLSRLGSPETKSMIMGVLVMLLAEYRMAEAQIKNQTNKRLHHVTIIEEAHNLLKNVANSTGGSELVAKSIEMISNAIAEMRTYGEGFIIVDQSPTAVDISAIKNTNTKIVMRLPEKNDCEAMANAMGLNENQQKEIAKLLPGKAIVMQNNWVAAVMVAVDEADGKYNGVPELISAAASRYVRAVLASAFADVAGRQIIGGADFNAIEWWKAIYRFLGRFVDSYQSNRNSGIGHAKANELFQMCEYYRKTLSLENLKSQGVIKRKYGQLIVNLLECENCWKNFQKVNRLSMSRLGARKEFMGLLTRYIPLKDAPLEFLTDCIIAYMCKGGVIMSGGTKEDARNFNHIFSKGEDHA